jgi:hypothetical protein
MIVIDVGCQQRETEESIHQLIDRYHPELLLGYDPDPALEEGTELIDGTVVIRRRAAGWISSGIQPVHFDGIRTGIDHRPHQPTHMVETVDIPNLIRALPTHEIILKLDCEGAEIEILTRLASEGGDTRLQLVLVEWHPTDLGTDHGRGWTRQQIRDFATTLRCPVEEWAYATTPVLTERELA